ncbi:MAG: hypothetical protein NVSMB32_03140 [Actinomycetota bacterium]
MAATGCSGPQAGVSIQFIDPSGQGYTGTGGATLPDGTLTKMDYFPAANPGVTGVYHVEATCVDGPGATLFKYPRVAFTMTP